MTKIEEEYAQYEVSKELQEKIINPYALVLNMEVVLDLLEKDERTILRARRRNRLAQGVFVLSRDALQQEEDIYNEMIRLVNENMDLLPAMTEVIDEKTWKEVLKLLDFLVERYSRNLDFYHMKLEEVEQARKGISYVDYKQSNTSKEVNDFLTNKINEMKEQKHLEKTDKI